MKETIAFPFEAATREHDNNNRAGSVDAIGDVIKKYRKKDGLTQDEFAEELDVKRNTVVKWETGRTRPTVEMLVTICHRLDIPITELFGVDMATSDLSVSEKNMVDDYRKLNPENKKAAKRIVHVLLEEEQDAKAEMLEKDYWPIATLETPAAAGPGYDYLDNKAATVRFYRRNPRFAGADLVCRVCGHSMEPYYRDGDYVYARSSSTADDGDDVICDSNDGRMIKRKINKNQLLSLNPDPKYAVHKSADDGVRIVAVVLGIVPEEDRVEKDLEPELEDIHIDEVSELKRKYDID